MAKIIDYRLFNNEEEVVEDTKQRYHKVYDFLESYNYELGFNGSSPEWNKRAEVYGDEGVISIIPPHIFNSFTHNYWDLWYDGIYLCFDNQADLLKFLSVKASEVNNAIIDFLGRLYSGNNEQIGFTKKTSPKEITTRRIMNFLSEFIPIRYDKATQCFINETREYIEYLIDNDMID